MRSDRGRALPGPDYNHPAVGRTGHMRPAEVAGRTADRTAGYSLAVAADSLGLALRTLDEEGIAAGRIRLGVDSLAGEDTAGRSLVVHTDYKDRTL